MYTTPNLSNGSGKFSEIWNFFYPFHSAGNVCVDSETETFLSAHPLSSPVQKIANLVLLLTVDYLDQGTGALCCIFWPSFGCCAQSTNLGQISETFLYLRLILETLKNVNLFFHFLLLYIHLLCISTSKRVLWMLFAGGNPLFGTLKDKSFISEKTISVWICKKNIALEISYKIVALFTENYPSHPKSLFWPVC